MVSQGTLDASFYVRVVVPELMPCSSMVERSAVNGVVVGSSPTGAVYRCRRLTRVTMPVLRGSAPNKNPAFVFPNPTDSVRVVVVSENLKFWD